tara:strand:- start:88 stop:732 length:645 start_codon:yes stop_codon:yes gene_type:complete
MNGLSKLVKEINLNEVDVTKGTDFYKQVLSNPEYKIQKIAEWDTLPDKKFAGYTKPKLTLTPEGSKVVDDFTKTVVYFFVVEETCLYIGQSSTSFKKRMAAYASAGRTRLDDKEFMSSGGNKGGSTNKKINKNVTSFKLTNQNDTIKIYAAYYAIPDSIQLLPNNGTGILSGEFDIAVPPTKVEKYYLELYSSIEGGIPQWQSNIDGSIYNPTS